MDNSEMKRQLQGSASEFLSRNLEMSEKVGRSLIDLHANFTTWAKGTALEPLFEAQRKIGSQTLDLSLEMARNICGVMREQGEQFSSAMSEQGRRIMEGVTDAAQRMKE